MHHLAFAIDINLNTYRSEMYLRISPILGRCCVQLGIAGVVVGSAITSLSFADIFRSTALAQVVPDSQIMPDRTLGADSSIVNSSPDGTDTISGGATRGSNLFHSFDSFSIPTNRKAFFDNPTEIQNIFSRITGGSISNIDGLIKANGTANLFLLNPNGIIFGPNAQLDVKGSFVASTANAIQFGDRGFFSATDPNAPPLLTVNPSAFLFNQTRAAAIENNSTADAGLDPAGNSGYFGLRVPDNKSLLLVGGDLKADGSGFFAFGGRVDLAAVAGTGTVGLNVNGDKLSLNVPDDLTRADVSLNNGAGFIVYAGGGGDIAITAGNINILSQSGLYAGILSDSSLEDAQAGDITLDATEAVTIVNGFVFNDVYTGAVGNAGNVTIETRDLKISDGGQVRTITSGKGNAGDLSVRASELVELDGGEAGVFSGLFNQVGPTGKGDGGNTFIETKHLKVLNGASVVTITSGKGNAGGLSVRASELVELDGGEAGILSGLFNQVNQTGEGNAGNTFIETKKLRVVNGAQVEASTFGQGDAGDLSVRASELVELDGGEAGILSGLFNQVTQTSEGNAGNTFIETKKLRVVNGAQVGANTFGQGDAGDLTVRASELVELDRGEAEIVSGLFNQTFGTNNSGNISIYTNALTATKGSEISASTFGKGNAGSVTINANTISFDGANSTGYTSKVSNAVQGKDTEGNAGRVNVITNFLYLTNGGQFNLATFGKGNAGNLNVTAFDSIEISGVAPVTTSGLFTSAIQGTGNGGSITVKTDKLTIKDGGTIKASNFQSVNELAPGLGATGSIDIDARSILLSNKGNINADSASGKGGNISIRADSLALKNGAFISSNDDTNTTPLNSAGVGEGGNIALRINDRLLMRNNSRISAAASSEASGGNISLDTKFLIAAPNENNDIIANAIRGRGGNISISAEAIFGIQQRSQQTPLSDITASSQLGVDGTVQLNSPEVDPSRDVVELPTGLVDASTLVASGCPSGMENRFAVTGRGGLPPAPGDKLTPDALLTDWATLQTPATANRATVETTASNVTNTTPNSLIEATSWQYDRHGAIILTSGDTSSPHHLQATPSSCPSS